MIKNYLKIALRGFSRHKLFTIINVLGLSIGISAGVVIYLIVQYDFSFDKFHPDGDRIYRVVTDFNFSGEKIYLSGVTGALPEAVRSSVTGLEFVAPCYDKGEGNVIIPGATFTKLKKQKGIVFADQRYFTMFPYKWLAGSAKSSLSQPNQVVLASTQAKKYFPSLSYDQMIGKPIIYEDSLKTTVTGIVAEFTENSDLPFRNFISYETMHTVKKFKEYFTAWPSTSGSSLLFVKLLPQTSARHIETQVNLLLKKNIPNNKQNQGITRSLRLQPLSDLHFSDKYSAMGNPTVSKSTLYGLMAIGGFLLLLACINFINLTTAQASRRAKEIGIRKTMGSSRRQLIFQYLSETFLVTLLAVVIAVASAPVILKLFADFIPKGVSVDFIHQPGLILFLFVLIIVVSLLSGFYPAFMMSGYKPVLVLKNQTVNSTSKTRNAWLRKSLTVTQFVIAQFFIMATVLVSKQIYYAVHKDLGFKKDAIVYFSTPYKNNSPAIERVLLNKIKAMPQVALVSQGGASPSSPDWSSSLVTYNDGKKEMKSDLQTKSGDENFISVYQIKLLAGRNIMLSDSTTGLLVNNKFAQIIGFKDPRQAIGKVVTFGKDVNMKIVGVVNDFHQGSLHDPIKPLGISADVKNNFDEFHIALKSETSGGDWTKAMKGIAAVYKQLYPDDEFEYHFFDEIIAKFYENEQHTSTLLTWATGLSIFISCLGLMGLAIYTTNQRTKEIGVRKVLGASVTQIVALLSSELMLLILFAFVLVTPIAWYAMNKWMQSFADRTAISWWIFALSGAGMLLAAIFTSSFQTIKAAIINPVKSLRSE